MSRSDSQELESQLFDDVEGLLKEYFQNNLRDQEANQTFLKASLKFLYRQLEKRLENFDSGKSCQKSSSRTESNIFSFRKQGEPSQCLPSLGYQEKVRYWASKYLHAGRTNLSRTSSSVAASRENFHTKEQDTSHTKLSNIDGIIQSGENPKESRLYLQKPERIGGSTTPGSLTSTEDRVLIIVSSGLAERVHNCESCVSLEGPDTSTTTVNDFQKKLLKNEYEDTISVDAPMNHSAWKGQNNTEKEENVMPDTYFKFITQSLEVMAKESVKLEVNDLNNSELFKYDVSTASESESTRMCKGPSISEAGYLDGIKDEGVFLRVSLSNPISSPDIATAPAEEEIRSNASSTKEGKKSRSPSSRIHAAILNLFGAKNTEKKSGNKSGCKSSKSSTGENSNLCKDEDTIKHIKSMLSNKLSMHSTGQTVTSDQQNVKQNTHEYRRSAFSRKSSGALKFDTSSCDDRKSKLEKLKKLKVCQIPFVPVCQSCDQIYTYFSSGRTTRDVATCTEELITGFSECKRCFSCIHGLESSLPYRSESIFSGLHYKLGHRDEIEELSIIFLCALLNDLRKRNRNTSSKMNSKSKRTTSRFPDVKSYGATSWPLSIRRHREHRAKTQQIYEKCAVNSEHKEKPGLLRQPSKFSAWNGDEKSSDSDDEEYRLKRHRLFTEHIAELGNLMSGNRLRSRVKSSLVIRSSHASEHIPSSKS